MLAAAGDVPTLEILAAADWLRTNVPDLRFRVVNVVDLMTLFPPGVHPHGMNETAFVDLFTASKPVIFAFHGYQRAIHEIIHGRVNAHRFHVRGYSEQGTTTTPFDMVVLNDMSRYHLAIAALRRSERFQQQASSWIPILEHRDRFSRRLYAGPPRGSSRDSHLGLARTQIMTRGRHPRDWKCRRQPNAAALVQGAGRCHARNRHSLHNVVACVTLQQTRSRP